MGRPSSKKKRKSAHAARGNWPLVASGFLFLFSCAIYLNTLGHGFVFDDVTLILQNARVTQLKWSEILSLSSYRPVRTLTYAINFWAGGRDAFGYHLFNVLLHGCNAVLLFRFFRKMQVSLTWAFSGALIFAAHPIQTAAVAYISGRKDMLATFFVLAGLLAYLSFRESRQVRSLLLVVVCFVLGVLSKEVALVFPALLLLTDLCRNRRSIADPLKILVASFRNFWWLYLSMVAMALAGLYYSVEVLQASRMEGQWGGSWSTNWGTSFKLFLHYLRLVVVPYPLLADYRGDVFAFSAGFSEPTTLASLLLTAAFVGFGIWAFGRSPKLTFGMFWLLIALLPVLQLIPFHELAADHFLYLAMVGPAFLAGFAVDRMTERTSRKEWVWAGMALVVLACTAATLHRNRDWKDNETLWAATYRMAPGSYRANCNLGGLAQQQRDLDRALSFTKRCLELDPTEALPYSNLGGLYRDLGAQSIGAGRLEEAESHLHKAIEHLERALTLEDNPWARSNLADAFKDLAYIAEIRGDGFHKVAELRQRAIEEFKRAVPRAAGYDAQAVIIYKLGAVYLDAGRYREALTYFLQCVDQLRQVAQPQAATGYAYLQLGQYGESIPFFERALALEATPDAFLGLARAQEALNGPQQAIATLETASRHFPSESEILYELGRLHVAAGDRAMGRAYLLRALQSSPREEISRSVRELLERIRGTGAGASR